MHYYYRFHLQDYDNWLCLQIGVRLFYLRKSDLKENSALYLYMYKNLSKIKEKAIPNKLRIISNILFAASLLSELTAITLISQVTNLSKFPIENMWICFLFTPIPIAPVIFGFMLKSKGYNYKKNIIVGIIMKISLCMRASFAFLF